MDEVDKALDDELDDELDEEDSALTAERELLMRMLLLQLRRIEDAETLEDARRITRDLIDALDA